MEKRTIRQWRIKRGLTQRQLGERIGVSIISIGNWESGRHEPSARQLETLASVFGVSMDAIAFHREDAASEDRRYLYH